MNDKLEQRAFILLLVTISALFFFLIKPFFASVFWACAIALVFYPVQQRLIRRWAHRPNLSALATLFICIVVADDAPVLSLSLRCSSRVVVEVALVLPMSLRWLDGFGGRPCNSVLIR